MIAGDITKVAASSIPDHDVLLAGFPCQPFSIAGVSKKKSLGKPTGFEDKTQGTLFFDVARILKDKRPLCFLLENVRGIINHDSGRTLNTILKALDELGYYVEWRVLNAKDYGIPQNRERWYCVGFKKSCVNNKKNKIFEWPTPKKLKYDLSDIIKEFNDEEYKISNICDSNIELNIKKKNKRVKNVENS